ncbi:hypothetical protein DUNSADRAFT_7811 [Dunaliella salina]|uniref:Encoded protein n=1 Tax=Dunaliella salina TaxID=3046 RepID=A0ABQ7FT74_DUNSA|nr:hypothetical protein DUNSADRAFT_7811 [Dunaliella salina]|eukprot:KAF5825654.1 hypothetical protein DUNSADRAFT_7811 [Dunaliella salina]
MPATTDATRVQGVIAQRLRIGWNAWGAPAVVMGQVASGHKRRAEGAEDEGPVPLGERGAEQEEVEDKEGIEEEGVPLGERVAAMEAQAEGRPVGGDGEGEPEDAPGPSGSSKADSVAVLLTQALRRCNTGEWGGLGGAVRRTLRMRV